MKLGRGFVRAIGWAVGIGLIAYGLSGLREYVTVVSLTRSIPDGIITTSLTNPGTTPMDDACETYSVGLSKPRYIYIEASRSAGCVHSVGVDQLNLIATPVNVNLAGWYASSVKPSDPGVSVMNGFVRSADNPGIFNNISLLSEGDDIQIHLGDNSKLHFTVYDIRSYTGAGYISHILDPISTTPQQLTLIAVDTATQPTTYTLVRSELQL